MFRKSQTIKLPFENIHNSCSLPGFFQVLAELKEYATEVDVDFVRKAVRAIGRCAIKVEASVQWWLWSWYRGRSALLTLFFKIIFEVYQSKKAHRQNIQEFLMKGSYPWFFSSPRESFKSCFWFSLLFRYFHISPNSVLTLLLLGLPVANTANPLLGDGQLSLCGRLSCLVPLLSSGVAVSRAFAPMSVISVN